MELNGPRRTPLIQTLTEVNLPTVGNLPTVNDGYYNLSNLSASPSTPTYQAPSIKSVPVDLRTRSTDRNIVDLHQ